MEHQPAQEALSTNIELSNTVELASSGGVSENPHDTEGHADTYRVAAVQDVEVTEIHQVFCRLDIADVERSAKIAGASQVGSASTSTPADPPSYGSLYVLPAYQTLIEQILVDAPPKYDIVTGVCLQIDSMAPEVNRKVSHGRNAPDSNTVTLSKSSRRILLSIIGACICISIITISLALLR